MHAMRTFDFAPFYRSTVGFDPLFSMLDQLNELESSAPTYPPYNIASAPASMRIASQSPSPALPTPIFRLRPRRTR